MRIALFQPEIPQNTGTILRMAACFKLPVDLIEPCGFVLTDKGLRRAGMDYMDLAMLNRYNSWQEFLENRPAGRLVLLTPHTQTPYYKIDFKREDTLLLGRESDGVPEEVREKTNVQIKIPMADGFRSLNVAIAAGIVLGEALRQNHLFPG